jgi:hypothetical protein
MSSKDDELRAVKNCYWQRKSPKNTKGMIEESAAISSNSKLFVYK